MRTKSEVRTSRPRDPTASTVTARPPPGPTPVRFSTRRLRIEPTPNAAISAGVRVTVHVTFGLPLRSPSHPSAFITWYGTEPAAVAPPFDDEYSAMIVEPLYNRICPTVAAIASLVDAASESYPPYTWQAVVSHRSYARCVARIR